MIIKTTIVRNKFICKFCAAWRIVAFCGGRWRQKKCVQNGANKIKLKRPLKTILKGSARWRHIFLKNKKICITYRDISLHFATVRYVAKSDDMWRKSTLIATYRHIRSLFADRILAKCNESGYIWCNFFYFLIKCGATWRYLASQFNFVSAIFRHIAQQNATIRDVAQKLQINVLGLITNELLYHLKIFKFFN